MKILLGISGAALAVALSSGSLAAGRLWGAYLYSDNWIYHVLNKGTEADAAAAVVQVCRQAGDDCSDDQPRFFHGCVYEIVFNVAGADHPGLMIDRSRKDAEKSWRETCDGRHPDITCGRITASCNSR